MRRLMIIVLIIAASCLWSQTIVEWKTSMGDFRAELREDLVPITAYNFRDLANDNFFDGFIFHRVIADFMIQDGDPLGTGYGGPGYTIPDEFHPDLTHERGVVSMANSGNPNTGGSQYFITVVPTHWLDNAHAIFGHIIEGMDVVDAISVVPTDNYDRPITPVVIDSIRVLTPPIDGFLPATISNTVDMGYIEVFLMDTDDFDLQYQWYVNDEQQTETSMLYTHTFDTAGATDIKCVATGDYECDYELVWHYEVINNAAYEDGVSAVVNLGSYPNPFNPETTISYEVPQEEMVSLAVYNMKGQLVEQLVNGVQPAGHHQLVWNALDQASGVYLVKYSSSSIEESRKLLYLK